MPELKCPHCHKIFKVDQEQYLSLVNQVKNIEFNKEIEAHLTLIQKQQEQKQQLLNEQLNQKHQAELFEFKTKIEQLKNIINNYELKSANDLKQQQIIQQQQIQQLQTKINDLQLENNKQQELYKLQLQAKEEEIKQIKDFKSKQSIKLIGEDLEQHCYNQFMQLKQDGILSSYCTLEKDNDSSNGTKGDFIYREYDSNQNEILSIMFEMKNESDQSKTKQTNESHLAKLNHDRQTKNCEYAILVSMLELDNPRFNGISDMSYLYEKMYVIRPQFFISIIGLLRNANKNAIAYKQQLLKIRQEEIDVTNFEEKLLKFQTDFGNKVNNAGKKFNKAIEEIDKSIKALEKVKENLLSSEKLLEQANDQTNKLTIRKLTYNNPTMSAKFKEYKD